jgi:hypothetical protein
MNEGHLSHRGMIVGCTMKIRLPAHSVQLAVTLNGLVVSSPQEQAVWFEIKEK